MTSRSPACVLAAQRVLTSVIDVGIDTESIPGFFVNMCVARGGNTVPAHRRRLKKLILTSYVIRAGAGKTVTLFGVVNGDGDTGQRTVSTITLAEGWDWQPADR